MRRRERNRECLGVPRGTRETRINCRPRRLLYVVVYARENCIAYKPDGRRRDKWKNCVRATRRTRESTGERSYGGGVGDEKATEIDTRGEQMEKREREWVGHDGVERGTSRCARRRPFWRTASIGGRFECNLAQMVRHLADFNVFFISCLVRIKIFNCFSLDM